MEKIEWQSMSTVEIRLRLLTLKNEYESKKNKIVILLDELDEMDRIYSSGENELIKRGER